MESDTPPRGPPGEGSEGPVPDSEAINDTNEYLSVKVASAMAGVADETIRALFDTGAVAGVRTAEGHRLISPTSLSRYMGSIGMGEAARLVDRPEYVVRGWFDQGLLTGYKTTTGRRRIDRSSILPFVPEFDL